MAQLISGADHFFHSGRRVSFRVAQKRTIQRVLRNREIKGIKTLGSGRLGGADMARSEG